MSTQQQPPRPPQFGQQPPSPPIYGPPPKRPNWFARHKVWTGVIVGTVVIGAISTAAEESTSSANEDSSIASSPAPQAPVEPVEVDKPKPRPEPKPEPKPEPEPMPEPGPVESVSQANARTTAEDYLSMMAFSRSGLIEQLEFEGYTNADATYAVHHVVVDWDEQAARSAQDYLDTQAFSRSGLIGQLMFEGYTRSQAEYGVSQAGFESKPDPESVETVSQQNARETAQDYLEMSGFSRSGLIDQLKYEGYSINDATYGVDGLVVDWKEQAARTAQDYLEMSGFSRNGLIDQLKYEGYTSKQAAYGATQVGL